tara:strand:- start:128 stop:451 length:324 start_codon:yes stop_codon:yes gene_type:complete
MAGQPDEDVAWWSRLLHEGPGFLYGFGLGVLSGYFGNWAWAKFRPKRKDNHMKLEVTDDGAQFTGLMNHENSEQILKVMKAAAKTSSSKKRQGSSYDTSGAQEKTNK